MDNQYIKFSFAKNVMNASGTLGFSLSHRSKNLGLGIFITNPISHSPRTPASGPRMVAFPGGVIFHTGLPNPGFSAVWKDHAKRWERSSVPVFVHLIGEHPETIFKMASRLENTEGVAGIELGLPPHCSLDLIISFVQAACGELPVMVRVPHDDAARLGPELFSRGITQISLGPSRGSVPLPHSGDFEGRLYGQGLYPQNYLMSKYLLRVGMEVISSGGVVNSNQVDELFDLGVAGVQKDLLFWR